jgi:hypothetical protein
VNSVWYLGNNSEHFAWCNWRKPLGIHPSICMSVVTVANLKQISAFLWLYFYSYPTNLNLVAVYVGLFS